MATQGRRGRPSKPYVASWGEAVPGLRREADGRWRDTDTRRTFAEPDERLAVARFRAMRDRRDDATVALRHEPAAATTTADMGRALEDLARRIDAPGHRFTMRDDGPGTLATGRLETLAPASAFWSAVRRLLIERPQLVADMTGIPQLASLADLPMPRPSIRLARLRDLYVERSHAKPKARREASRTFDAFVKATGAETLADLRPEPLVAYREAVKATLGPATVAAYFGRVRNVIRFGKSEGEDAAQIDAALSRLAVLKAPPDDRTLTPSPVTPSDFHALCDAAARDFPHWRPRLMLMLNAALHFDEALGVRWDELDLKAGTFCSRRNKRGRVIRAATLWPETTPALAAVPRTGSPFVFASAHGTRFNPTGQWKTWDKLRKAAGCPHVQLDDLRDGSYSAACAAPDVEERFARLLAGHRSHGLQDNYVARNPAIVRPACEAVRIAYFAAERK